MRYTIIATCLLALMACGRDETEVASPTSATDTNLTGTVTTTNAATVDRRWGDWTLWDVDRNDRLARNEFDTRFENVYTTWDADRSGTLTRDEMADTWYDLWDNNNDNIVDEQEWTRATSSWRFKDVDFKSWRDWDLDNDGRLLEQEFKQNFAPIYRAWDRDTSDSVSRDEMRDSWWDLFDGNNDDFIDSNEWRGVTWS